MRRIDLTGTIIDKQTPRDVQTKYGPAIVTEATLRDSTGTITLTLWNDNIDKIAINQKVEVINAYATSYQGNLKIDIGRYGVLKTVDLH